MSVVWKHGRSVRADPSIIVAVLDEGVMYTHPDLKGNMWINEKEELYADEDAEW